MCGITGIYNVKTHRQVDASVVKRMTDSLLHRGPDEDGYYVKGNVGLGMRRLSIIDLSGGKQPIFNEDNSLCVVFNGEIFNYIELREALIAKGHQFRTRSDTEVIVHLYEEYGLDFPNHMNGQFAIALWNEKNKQLVLARDRVGIRPLFYTFLSNGDLVFGSEMKALFCHPGIDPEIDPVGIDQVFTLWSNVPPHTVFKGVQELAPGHLLTVSPKGIKAKQYWKLRYPDEQDYEDRPLSYYVNKLQELLYDATTIRLRADVPVAAYLSGGLDSSITSALVKKYHNNDLITFSVTFTDPQFDERSHQERMVSHLHTDHRVIETDYDSIGQAFSDVVWYAEKPMTRTAPAPLYLLSGLVRQKGIKVVLTGEGADEIFGGYDIFKEDKIRRFWAEVPDSKLRPLLLASLYPDVVRDHRADRFWQSFFAKDLTDTDNPFYSHLLRWKNTSYIKRFFTDSYRGCFDEQGVMEDVRLYIDPQISRWHPLCRAQYLETALFMSGYLLSSQGDRMMMGHSVEGRFPFLDYRVIEFANTVPPKYKIKALNEKYILKKAYEDLLPQSIVNRVKKPYRAPISQCFSLNKDSIASRMLSPEAIKQYGYFDVEAVGKLLHKAQLAEDGKLSERDEMALVGIVSLQLLHHHFVERSKKINSSPAEVYAG